MRLVVFFRFSSLFGCAHQAIIKAIPLPPPPGGVDFPKNRKCQKVENGFLVRVKSTADQDRALKLDGGLMKEKRIRVQRAKVKMTTEDIFTFIADQRRLRRSI